MPDIGAPLTPIETAMMIVLMDGHAHSLDELLACMDIDCRREGVYKYMWGIRKKMRVGETIITEWRNRKAYYRWVRLIGSAANGRR